MMELCTAISQTNELLRECRLKVLARPTREVRRCYRLYLLRRLAQKDTTLELAARRGAFTPTIPSREGTNLRWNEVWRQRREY